MVAIKMYNKTDIQIPGHLEKCEGAIAHFWAKIASNRTILANVQYYELAHIHFFALLGRNCTFSHFLAKIALL